MQVVGHRLWRTAQIIVVAPAEVQTQIDEMLANRTSPSDSNDCSDSMLLVPFGDHNREPIRRAIAGLRPTGQTPIAYALNQASRDFGLSQDDRAVVLVTDRVPAGFVEQAAGILEGMGNDAMGREVLETFAVDGFVRVGLDAWAEARASIQWPRLMMPRKLPISNRSR